MGSFCQSVVPNDRLNTLYFLLGGGGTESISEVKARRKKTHSVTGMELQNFLERPFWKRAEQAPQRTRKAGMSQRHSASSGGCN